MYLKGSVFGPILYVLYTAPLADILQVHEMQFHFYADDTQLNISFSSFLYKQRHGINQQYH